MSTTITTGDLTEDTAGDEIYEVPLTGSALLETPMLNKGTGFTAKERAELGLQGLLPPHVQTLEEQVARAHAVYRLMSTDLKRHIYLRSLQDANETLFYRLLMENLTDMIPILYTPTVAEACQSFSRIYRKPRGLFVSFPERDAIEAMLDNAATPLTEVIVVTDGERILGLGDQGAGGMAISIGKLSLYTLCGGIHPARTLPVLLDVGTNDSARLGDPLYLGWRHERITGRDYEDFIELFVRTVIRKLPNVLLQWEDFSLRNARPILERYRDRLCTFNDDIQGTAAVTMATILIALGITGKRVCEQIVTVVGAGSAGTGIAEQLITAMVKDGLPASEARARLFMVDRPGLLHDGMKDLPPFQKALAQPLGHVSGWRSDGDGRIALEDVVKNARPTVLIGVSGQPGLFTEEVVREMGRHAERPIILPLSNPNSRCEAAPADLIAWTDGRALVATGSPYEDVNYAGRTFPIAQNNNCFIFPGIGLGVCAVGARRVTDEMLTAAAFALSECAIGNAPDTALLPPVREIRRVSRHVALAVAAEAQRQGLAEPSTAEELDRRIAAICWEPRYMPIKRMR